MLSHLLSCPDRSESCGQALHGGETWLAGAAQDWGVVWTDLPPFPFPFPCGIDHRPSLTSQFAFLLEHPFSKAVPGWGRQ